MAHDTLLSFFEDFAVLDEPFLIHDDGYRVRGVTYRELAEAARQFAAAFAQAGLGPGDKIIVWAENRPEWVAALWGAILSQAVLVPIDFRASAELVHRIATIVQAKLILVGDEVPAIESSTTIWHLAQSSTSSLERGIPRTHEPLNPVTPEPGTLAEIIFTSGATADPKGVTITHRNILANIRPIEREIAKYRKYERPFHPLRFLNLLPLSHMFGQSMATFVPPLLAGTVIFSHGYSPHEILRQIKTRRVSVLVCVPKVLDVLAEHVRRVAPEAVEPDALAGKRWFWRWWRYRRIHRLFGWKFWCIVCGAAPLDPELEAFWRKLGFLVVQGYGLTETAPIVTLNHPLRASRGTVGAPIPGVEVQIAADGEILVRGDNVTSGYYRPAGMPAAAAAELDAAFEGGWFHTGDIGEFDAAGRLLIKGRKKEMIVTAQGLNVFPEDVERELLAEPGVVDAAVVGVSQHGEERVHAVLITSPGADARAIVRGANARLADHQRIWSTSIWPGDALPRTEGTKKLRRREIQRWAVGDTGGRPIAAATGTTIESVVGRFAGGREIAATTTLDELGLSSLDRVELMMALEEAFQTTLDEGVLASARTVGDLKALVSGSPGAEGALTSPVPTSPVPTSPVPPFPSSPVPPSTFAFPSWNRSGVSWFVRRISLPTWILPLARIFMRMRVEGLEHLASIKGPVVFAVNHQSHMDVPAVMIALPAKWRYRTAPAMAKEFFDAHFHPERFSRIAWFTNSLNYYLSCQFFSAFPLPQREAGTRETLRYIGEIVAGDYSVLIFPEGKRSDHGEINPFRPGVGMMGARLGVPVVPVRLEGLDTVLHPRMKWPKRGPVRIAFGAPLRLKGEDYAALAKHVECAVRAL